MEELKLLVESIAGLPDLAIWVIAMYFFFKLAIVGSIFGVARLFINKLYDSFRVKYSPKEVVEKVVTRDNIEVYDISFGKYIINGVEKDIYRDIDRLLRGLVQYDKNRSYIHSDDASKLTEFVDSYLDKIRSNNKK